MKSFLSFAQESRKIIKLSTKNRKNVDNYEDKSKRMLKERVREDERAGRKLWYSSGGSRTCRL